MFGDEKVENSLLYIFIEKKRKVTIKINVIKGNDYLMQNNFYIYDIKIAAAKSKKIFEEKSEIFQIFIKFIAIAVIFNNLLIEIVEKTSNLTSKTISKSFIIPKIITLLFEKKKRPLKKNFEIDNKRIKMNIKIFISILNALR